MVETKQKQGICIICGGKFEIRKPCNQKCCSDKCRLRRRKQRHSEYYSTNKKKLLKLQKEYAYKNKDKVRQRSKRAYYKNRTKALARAKTKYFNEKTGICFDCKKQIKTDFHHLSYEPNIFIEVCRKCHNKRHGKGYYEKQNETKNKSKPKQS